VVVLITDRWDPGAGGGRERYLADLAVHLARRGETVRVYAGSGESGGEAVRVPVTRVFGRGAAELSFQRGAKRLLATEHSPILAARPVDGATHYQLHSGLLAASFEAEREALTGLRRFLHRPAGRLNAKRRLLLAAEARLLGSPSRPKVMAFSRSLAAALTALYGVPEDAMTVAPPGIDETTFHGPGDFEPPAGPSYLFVANNFLLKGLAPALEALERVRRTWPSTRLTVVGSGARGPFLRRARSLGVLPGVHFVGAVPRAALAPLYRASTALLHPTFFDPFALVTAEALASGCPVVTTARNGASEVIEPGRQGFVVNDPRDADALARALLEIAEPGVNRGMRREAAALGARLGFTPHVDAVCAWLGLRTATSG
jgi:UDP-glucose:(heptosyl)LPS alpha-1,3-glucosyltransferase